MELIPRELCKVKSFESVSTFIPQDGGRLIVPELTGPSLEWQINAWLTNSGDWLRNVGAVTVLYRERKVTSGNCASLAARGIAEATAVEEKRILVVVYTPAIEYDDAARTAALFATLPGPDPDTSGTSPAGAGNGTVAGGSQG